MALPTYDQAILPILKLLADGNVWAARQITVTLADQLGLTEEERQERTPSGKQTVLRSRVHWATYYAKRAGLLESTKRGAYAITDRGRAVLAERPQKLDAESLLRFPEFAEWVGKKVASGDAEEPLAAETSSDPGLTPDQRLDQAFAEIKESVASDLLDRILQGTWAFFERVVMDLLLAMGYGDRGGPGAGFVTQRSRDEGIDGVIKQDPLGLENIYLQAKHYTDKSVGRREIQEFAGSLDGHRAHKGVFVTTSRFSVEAREYVGKTSSKRIVLIDGQELVRLMIRYGVGVSEERNLSIPRIDLDYFDADSG
ncbi:restriction endonuclease [bacterium CPR1]|nr:restriction endonuclease [bacterium CPR1]